MDSESWVPIVRGLDLDSHETETYSSRSKVAQRLVDQLSASGIPACQRIYEFDTTRVLGTLGASGGLVERVAVVVHNRDRARASEIAVELDRELEREEHVPLVSDEDLARQAMAAGPPAEI